MLSEIRSGLFITDRDPNFLPIPDPEVKKAADHGSGSSKLADSTLFVSQASLKHNLLSHPLPHPRRFDKML
jgi:hypothetical protein